MQRMGSSISWMEVAAMLLLKKRDEVVRLLGALWIKRCMADSLSGLSWGLHPVKIRMRMMRILLGCTEAR